MIILNFPEVGKFRPTIGLFNFFVFWGFSGIPLPRLVIDPPVGGKDGPSRRIGALQPRKRNARRLCRQGRFQGRAPASGNFRPFRALRVLYDIVCKSAGTRPADKSQSRNLGGLVALPALSMESTVRRAAPEFITPTFLSYGGIYEAAGRFPILHIIDTKNIRPRQKRPTTKHAKNDPRGFRLPIRAPFRDYDAHSTIRTHSAYYRI